MIRTLSLRSTLSKMSKELSRRLTGSHLADWRGTLLVADAREKVSLDIDRSAVGISGETRAKHCVRGGEQIAQLILGSDEPGAIVEAAGMRVTGDARKLIQVLFPNEHPRLCALDSY